MKVGTRQMVYFEIKCTRNQVISLMEKVKTVSIFPADIQIFPMDKANNKYHYSGFFTENEATTMKEIIDSVRNKKTKN